MAGGRQGHRRLGGQGRRRRERRQRVAHPERAEGTAETGLINGARPETVEWEDGTQTVSERWASEEGRNAWFRSANLKIYVQHHDIGMDEDLAWEHDLMGVPAVQAAVMPDDENVSVTRLYRDGVTGKLYLGDLNRAALRTA